MADYLPYTAEEIPVKKIFILDETEYTYQVNYNSTLDFYTLYILDNEDNILFTNKLVYDNDSLLYSSPFLSPLDKQIIPFDFAGGNVRLQVSNFGIVKLYLDIK